MFPAKIATNNSINCAVDGHEGNTALVKSNDNYRAIKKKRKNSLTQQNDHTSVNLLAIWLKFFIKVDETCMKLLYFVSHPLKTLIKIETLP